MRNNILVIFAELYFAVLFCTFPDSEAHGFEVLRGPCSPGSVRSPNPCESCWCGFFGFQYYCIKTCFYYPPVITTTTTTTRSTSTVSPTSRRFLGAGNQIRNPVSSGNQDAAVRIIEEPTTTTTTTTEFPLQQQTPRENDEDMAFNILPVAA